MDNKTKKIKMVLVGGGFITQYYELGFKNSNNVKLIGLADLNENCLARSIYKDIPFYTDFKKMIAELKLDQPIYKELCKNGLFSLLTE